MKFQTKVCNTSDVMCNVKYSKSYLEVLICEQLYLEYKDIIMSHLLGDIVTPLLILGSPAGSPDHLFLSGFPSVRANLQSYLTLKFVSKQSTWMATVHCIVGSICVTASMDNQLASLDISWRTS